MSYTTVYVVTVYVVMTCTTSPHLDDELVLLRVAARDDQIVLAGDEPVEALKPVRLARDGRRWRGAHLRVARGGERSQCDRVMWTCGVLAVAGKLKDGGLHTR